MKKTLIRIVSMMVIMSILVTANVIYSSAASNKIADGTYICKVENRFATLKSGELIMIDIKFKIVIKGGELTKIKIKSIDGYKYDKQYDEWIFKYIAEANNLVLSPIVSGKRITLTVKNKPNKYTWFWYPQTGTVDGSYYLDENGNWEKEPDMDTVVFFWERGTIDLTCTFTF